MPWRRTSDPYKIWLSEIILQQTQVKQGLPYYEKFVTTYPTVHDLAGAKEEEVLKLWQGLGYYSRARNLHFTAKYVSNDLNGDFPNSYNEIIKLKGIGDYTAAAISSFAYKEAVPVLDGNVFRLLSRYFGIDTPINTTEGVKKFKELVNVVFDVQNPAEHNQAIMEFGALMCKPKTPDCIFCPLQQDCSAYHSGKVNELPVKLKKLKRRKRFFNYLIITNTNKDVLIRQRLEKDIWQKLFEFPLLELDCELEFLKQDHLKHLSVLGNLNNLSISKLNNRPLKHVLSHQDIFANFWKIETSLSAEKITEENLFLVNKTQLSSYAMPVLISKFIEQTTL